MSTIILNINLLLHTLVLQLLPHVLLEDAVLVADVVPHNCLPVRQVPTLALRNGTVERFRHRQLPGEPLLEMYPS